MGQQTGGPVIESDHHQGLRRQAIKYLEDAAGRALDAFELTSVNLNAPEQDRHPAQLGALLSEGHPALRLRQPTPSVRFRLA